MVRIVPYCTIEVVSIIVLCCSIFFPILFLSYYKPIGASPRRDYRSDEDGTILAHNILHGFDWNIEKGGNAPRAPDEMRDFYPPQASLY